MHIESGRHLYGGARQVACLTAGLARAGVENVLVVRPGAGLAAAAGACRVVEQPMAGELDFAMRDRIRAVIERERPDLVHVHSRNGADRFGGRAARLAACPAVLTRRVDNPEIGVWARSKYRPYDRLIAISTPIAGALIRHAGAERVVLIPSAVDARTFRPDAEARRRLLDAHSLPDDALLLGVVGQLIRRKGHDVLVDAMARLAETHPRLRALVFGRGPLERALSRRIRSRRLDGRFVLAGFREDAAEWMPGLDVLVHPARREGLGVAVLEAMSAGVAVVASRAGGLVDLIDDGESGILVRPGDARDLAAALDRVLADAALRRRIGAAGRQRAIERFSVERMIDAHIHLYEQVLERRGRGD